jgi:hypothetical protein
MSLLASIIAVVFLFIALVHIYWAFGGQWGLTAAVPQQPDGCPLFAPGIGVCMVIAFGFFAFAYICLARTQMLPSFGFERFARWAILVIAVIFLLRTFGDRRYCGLTRKITNTSFAQHDRKFFTPLCAALSIALLLLAFC